MTRFQTFLIAVIALSLSIIAANTVFGIRDARASFSSANLHPVFGDFVQVVFYNDVDNCLYEFRTKANGPARKLSCVTGLN